MDKDQAEQKIVEIVGRISAIRVSGAPDRDEQIALLDAEIRELKKITGPRRIVGKMER